MRVRLSLATLILTTFCILAQVPPVLTKAVIIDTVKTQTKFGIDTTSKQLMDSVLFFYVTVDSMKYEIEGNYEVLISQQRILSKLRRE